MHKRIKQVLTDNAMRPDLIEAMGSGIESYYAQPHRHYHTIEHIVYMLEQMDKAGWNNPELSFNVLLHDVFYKVPSPPGHNEKVSELMAGSIFKNCCEGQISLSIAATAGYSQTHKDLPENTQRLLDLDLCSMARPNYTLFTKQHDALIKEAPGGTRPAMADFLANWLQSRPDGFFYTAHGRVEWWPKALANIERYIRDYQIAKKAPKLVKKKAPKKKRASTKTKPAKKRGKK